MIATIFKSVPMTYRRLRASACKVRLHDPDCSMGVDHTITVAYGDSISITLSDDEDKWLIAVYCDGVPTCSMFADYIQKGNY